MASDELKRGAGSETAFGAVASVGKSEGVGNRKKLKMQMKAVWLGYTSGAILCAVFALVAAREVWPPMDGDGAMLFPPAVELARGNGLVNTPWVPPMNDTIDGPGGRRHISHGFLNQLLVGMAAAVTGGDAVQCVAWSHFIVLLAAATCAAGVLSWRSARSHPSAADFALGFLSVTAFFALAFAWFGRAEPLVMVWVGAATLALRFLPANAALLSCGIFLGLTAWTSPMSALIGALLLGVFMVLRPIGPNWREIALVAAGGLIATVASFAIYPYTLPEWIGGTIRHSRIHFDHPSFQGLMQSWIARPHVPLLVVTFGLLATGAFVQMTKSLQGADRWRKALAVVGCLVLAFVLFRLTVVRGEAVYNVAAVLPVLAVAAAHGLRGLAGSLVLLLAFLLPTLGLARTSVLLVAQVRNGPAYDAVRGVIAEKIPDGLILSKGLWLAVPDLGSVAFGRPDFARTQPQWFIDQQLATGRVEPKQYSGYRLVEDKFSGPVRIFGFPISRAPTGWQYALYQRTPSGN